jgi:hypothetical protein
MPFDIKLTISGLQEAQDDNARRIEAMKPTGAVGEAVKHVTAGAHRYLVAVTHVDTGAYRASQRMDLDLRGLRGRLYVDPTATNPRSGQKPSVYGEYEEARGGEHAAYERTEKEAGPRLVEEAVRIIERGVGYGS